ncbi:MAG: TetR/AcrR family transcriptional regulator, partial [Polyangiales bacterium]
MTKVVGRAGKPARKKARVIGRPVGGSRELTRQRILRAANACFGRVGYEHATNRDIAEAADLTAAAIYRHFPSKPDLYVAVVADALGELVVRLRAAADQPSARAALRSVLRAAVIEPGSAGATRFLSTIPHELQRHPELASRMVAAPGEVFAILQQIAAAGVRSGEIARAKSDRVVATMVTLFM